MTFTLPHRIARLLWVGLIAAVVPALAQDLKPSSAAWALTVQIGAPVSGPSAAIRRLMETNGLGGTSSFFSISYPITKSTPSLSLRGEVFRPHSSMGGTVTISESRVEGSSDATVRWRAISLAQIYSFYARQRTHHISIGPSIQWLLTETGTTFPAYLSTSDVSRQTRVVPGLAIDGALRFPARSKCFIDLGTRYEAAFGQVHNELTYRTGAGTTRTVPVDLSFNRFMVTVGVGLRLGGKN